MTKARNSTLTHLSALCACWGPNWEQLFLKKNTKRTENNLMCIIIYVRILENRWKQLATLKSKKETVNEIALKVWLKPVISEEKTWKSVNNFVSTRLLIIITGNHYKSKNTLWGFQNWRLCWSKVRNLQFRPQDEILFKCKKLQRYGVLEDPKACNVMQR